MIKVITELLTKSAQSAGIADPIIKLEHPEDISHGDFSSNVAMIHAKGLKIAPKILAEKIVEECTKALPREIASVEVAGAGFINIKIVDSFFTHTIQDISKDPEKFGRLSRDVGRKVMVEYTDPNPFKIFHIGHLMANTIGESISRLVQFSGAEVIRVCYQGDVGLHVAKTLWAVQKNTSVFTDDLIANIQTLGAMYVIGSEKYETDEIAKQEIVALNKKIFERSDIEVNKLYDFGKKISLEYFDTIYVKLGTHFDHFFFESEVAGVGIKIVQEFLKKGVFEESDGAIIFPGEKYGEHTRVFINSQGLPTYETKELGLTEEKFKKYPDLAESIVVTANEQDAYFKVILKALALISLEQAQKTKHISHGILRPKTGKMSSRKGNIVPAETMLEEIENLVAEKMKDRQFSAEELKAIRKDVSVAALKYSILRQAIGGDIIYDPEKAVSFEGDSGPYLQYSAVRANAVVMKAREAGISEKIKILPEKVELLEKLLLRFPEIVERSRSEYAPHHIVTYLIELAGAFNSYYTNHKIIDEKDPFSPYKVSLTNLFAQTMTNALWVLGIEVPKKM